MTSFSLPTLSLEIVEGNIVDERVDALVNAANNAFWMGAGVAGAIKARGGERIEIEAMAQGPVEPGACVVTSAGQLAARHVIHAAVMGQNLKTSATIIEEATHNALVAADDLGLQSVALPAFGTGVGGFPLEGCARIMIETIGRFGSAARSIRLVRLVLFGEAACKVFERVGRETFGRQTMH